MNLYYILARKRNKKFSKETNGLCYSRSTQSKKILWLIDFLAPSSNLFNNFFTKFWFQTELEIKKKHYATEFRWYASYKNVHEWMKIFLSHSWVARTLSRLVIPSSDHQKKIICFKLKFLNCSPNCLRLKSVWRKSNFYTPTALPPID